MIALRQNFRKVFFWFKLTVTLTSSSVIASTETVEETDFLVIEIYESVTEFVMN
ncbi:hypothetical protein [Flammeovirga kamogawensis]|uniref:Uncharacterized protein n=1 Tax=Flammeovirga kamogawensis TaxID=373891 RepID=A0ABX8GU58_9BACT|nr:hypothetical protein [Flammeovirga kamogawensis]MBB6460019.1 hypothetical protein [Flammeovirga kamogawensis]QWG06933.1 hypothetical protein KM029_16730 [Flammeovirga kamogawensis]